MSTTSWGAWGVPDCIFPLTFLWKESNLRAPRPPHDRAEAQLSRMLGWDTSIHTPGPNDNTHVDKCTVTRQRSCVVLTSAPGNSTEQSLRYPVKSCNYPGAVRHRDGWEQQNQSRSNKRSSDHLWQMEVRNLSLFGDSWRFGHFREKPKPSWFFLQWEAKLLQGGEDSSSQSTSRLGNRRSAIIKSAQSRLRISLPCASPSPPA